jgi:hypothetical protein
VIAHIAGVPLEETLVPLLSGLGSGLVLARAWAAGTIGRNGGRSGGRNGGRNGRRRRDDDVPSHRNS